VLWTVRSTLDVDFEGAYDGGRLALAGNDAERASLEVSREVAPALAVFAEANAETFRPAASGRAALTTGGAPAGFYDYPGSVQAEWSVGAGLRACF
jgi:hypothetical protein